MSSFDELHVDAPVAALLAAWGWNPDAPDVRDAVATLARGNNLVLLAPPSPAYAAPALAGFLAGTGGGPTLILSSDAELGAWGALVHQLATATGRPSHIARGEARAATALRGEEAIALVATPGVAQALVARSVLKADALAGVVLARPEMQDDDAIAILMADLPTTAARLIITSNANVAGNLGERYARRAMTVTADPLPLLASDVPFRMASAPWDRRAEAVAEVLELLDPPRAVVWAADRSAEAELGRAVALDGTAVQLLSGDVARAPLIICYDLPGGDRLAALQQAGDVVVLSPPGTAEYVERLGRVRRPLRLSGWLDGIRDQAGRVRADIIARVSQGGLAEAAHVLSPLLQRFDAGQVAAALYALWQERPAESVAPVSPSAGRGDTARVWMGVGTRDNATIADIVATLVKEVGLDRARIGKVDVRESFTLVEVPALEVERVAERANGLTIRRRRVVARPDRGPERAARGPRPERQRR